MATTYTPIATTTLGSNQNAVTFSSISGSYTDLIMVINGYNTAGGYYYLRVGNGSVDTGNNYSRTRLAGDGSTAYSDRQTNTSYVQLSIGTSANGNTIINLNNYANTSTYKTILSRYNFTTGEAAAVVGLWRSTSAINTVSVIGGGGDWVAGSTFTLYGIKAA